MPVLTHPRLREIAAYNDAVRARLADVVGAAPRAAMVAAPAESRWSGAQIVQHLGKVEGATAKMLEGVFAVALAAGLPPDGSTGSMLRSLDRFQGDGEVIRALVAPERLRPEPAPDLEASWASLSAVRERLLRAYATVDGRDLTGVVAPHPLFGPLNAYEWLLFIGKHEERHVGQLRRLLSATSS
jgi:uncharacterized damage-inducible protein DinB